MIDDDKRKGRPEGRPTSTERRPAENGKVGRTRYQDTALTPDKDPGPGPAGRKPGSYQTK